MSTILSQVGKPCSKLTINWPKRYKTYQSWFYLNNYTSYISSKIKVHKWTTSFIFCNCAPKFSGNGDIFFFFLFATLSLVIDAFYVLTVDSIFFCIVYWLHTIVFLINWNWYNLPIFSPPLLVIWSTFKLILKINNCTSSYILSISWLRND